MEGQENFLDNLFQAAREEPVGSSAKDMNQLLQNSGNFAGAAQSGGASWWGASSFTAAKVVGGIAVVIGIGVLYGVLKEEEPAALPVAEHPTVVETQPIAAVPQEQAATFTEETAADTLTQASAVELTEEETPTAESEAVASNPVMEPKTTVNETEQATTVRVATAETINTPAQHNNHDEHADELGLNNLFLNVEMPKEDPYAQTETAPTLPAAPVIVDERTYTIGKKATDHELQALGVNLAAHGIELEVINLQRKGKKIKYFSWRTVFKGEGKDKGCPQSTSTFNEMQFRIFLDEKGVAQGIIVLIEKGTENCVISYGTVN